MIIVLYCQKQPVFSSFPRTVQSLGVAWTWAATLTPWWNLADCSTLAPQPRERHGHQQWTAATDEWRERVQWSPTAAVVLSQVWSGGFRIWRRRRCRDDASLATAGVDDLPGGHGNGRRGLPFRRQTVHRPRERKRLCTSSLCARAVLYSDNSWRRPYTPCLSRIRPPANGSTVKDRHPLRHKANLPMATSQKHDRRSRNRTYHRIVLDKTRKLM